METDGGVAGASSETQTDPGRKYGTVDPKNKNRFVCNFCGKPSTGGVYRLKQHLVGGVRNVTGCLKCPAHVREEIRTFMLKKVMAKNAVDPLADVFYFGDEGEEEIMVNKVKRPCYSSQGNVSKNPRGKGLINTYFTPKPEDILKGRKGGRQQTINEVCKKELRGNACREIGRWFYDAGIPFHTATYDSFKIMLEAVAQFGPGFQAPTMHELRVPLLRKEVEDTKTEIESHKKEWASKGCSILSDGWRDSTVQKDIVNFLVNSPKGSVFMKSIDVSEITKDAKTLVGMLENMVDEVGEANVIQIVTDNASNYVKAGK